MHLSYCLLSAALVWSTLSTATAMIHHCIHDKLSDEGVVAPPIGQRVAYTYTDTDGARSRRSIAIDRNTTTATTTTGRRPRSPPSQNDSTPNDNKSNEKLYHPIRIAVSYQVQNDFSKEDNDRLKRIIDETISQIEQLFSVVPVKGNLLLSRDGCLLVAKTGVNAGKCMSSKRNYQRPIICMDNFEIPDDHLDGLEIYNDTSERPVRVLKRRGRGVEKADYILYVKSESTHTCRNADVVAYATYCQHDQKYRPIAGLINFCPNTIDTTHSDDFIKKVALHEMFHALGFTTKLFKHFQSCVPNENNTDVVCGEHKGTPIGWTRGGKEARLSTPRVRLAGQKHFACTSDQMSGVKLSVTDGQISSHWDARLMQSSIMTSGSSQAHLIKTDLITLSAFEDSGWYKVNYDLANPFVWGKDAGCNFAKEEMCLKDEKYFCHEKGKTGCHFLHEDKAVCKTDPSLQDCYLYKVVDSSARCYNTMKPIMNADGELFSSNSRCFMSSLQRNRSLDYVLTTPSSGDNDTTAGDVSVSLPILREEQEEQEEQEEEEEERERESGEEGRGGGDKEERGEGEKGGGKRKVEDYDDTRMPRCYLHKCLASQLHIKIGRSEWFMCPSNQRVKVKGYDGTIKCPVDTSIICPDNMHTTNDKDKNREGFATPSSGTVLPNPVDMFTICVKLRFNPLKDTTFMTNDQMDSFHKQMYEYIIKVTKNKPKRIYMRQINVHPTALIYLLDLQPDLEFSNLSVLYELGRMIDRRELTINIAGGIYIALTIRHRIGNCKIVEDPNQPNSGSVWNSYLLAVVVSVIVTCLLAIVMLLVYRRYFNKQ